MVKTSLREWTYKKLTTLGPKYREVLSTSEAVQISTEGVEQLEIYFGRYVPQFFYSLLAPLTLFIIVSFLSFKVALVLLLCVPLIPISIIAVQKFAKKMLAKYWGTYVALGDSFLENLHGLTTLKIYQADERYAQKMDDEAEQFRRITMRVLIMQLNSISIMDLIAYGGAGLGIILSVLEYQKGMISFGACFFIVLIAAEFFLPLRLLGSFFHIAMNGHAAANKIFKLLDTPIPPKGDVTTVASSTITCHDLSFGYTKDKTVLNHISFTVPERSFTALVGTSGCGKSTIASLLMGQLNASSGILTLGDTPISMIHEATLMKKITRIRHDSYLFKGTIRDNLLMGNARATDTQLYDVLRQVDLEETVRQKGGLAMQVEEKASNFSGGQKQRLVLARALLHDSDIYIFDEATSNIDAESENKIMNVIRELSLTKTIILISHRLANVIEADQILLLDKGQMIEQGNHQTLMSLNGQYHNLYTTQQTLERFTQEEVTTHA